MCPLLPDHFCMVSPSIAIVFVPADIAHGQALAEYAYF